jgi:hypothetical protein
MDPSATQERKFLPFYERLANCVVGYAAGRIAISAFVGFGLLAFHKSIDFWLVGKERLNDWSWFLAVLISAAMLCVYYATYTLQTVCAQLDSRLRPEAVEAYRGPLTEILSDFKFIRAGIFFGGLNCLVGYWLGLPYAEVSARVTIFICYFVAGFVCGMAVWGIYGVSKVIRAFFSKAEPAFDFTAPDHCGGTGFLGDALVVFASVTLIVAVMISIYIFETDWRRPDTWGKLSVRIFWIVFPYICSLVALLGPAIPIANKLRQYKLEQELGLQKRLREIRAQLESQTDPTARKDLREDYEFQQSRRKDLHAMRTWPFGLGANLKYLSVIAGNAFAQGSSALKWLHHFQGH